MIWKIYCVDDSGKVIYFLRNDDKGDDYMKIKKHDIFIMLLMFYMFIMVLLESRFIDYNGFRSIISALRYLDLGLVIIYIVSEKSIGGNGIVLLLTMLVITAFNFIIFNGGTTILGIVLFAIASRNCPLKRIFFAAIISLTIAHLFVALSSAVGIVDDTVNTRYISEITGQFFEGEYNRHGLGFLVTNQAPLAFMIVYMFFIVYKKGNVTLFQHIIAVAINFILYDLCGARIVFALSIPFTAIVYCMHIWEHKPFAFKYKYKKRFSLFKMLLRLMPVVICVISFAMALLYDSTSKFYSNLNLMFNNRLYFAQENIKYFGISLFGSGKISGTSDALLTVDNGYIITFLQNGIILGCLIIACWVYMSYIATKRNNSYLALVILVLAIENIINSHLISYKMIPMFCMIINNNDPLIGIITTKNGPLYNKNIKMDSFNNRLYSC